MTLTSIVSPELVNMMLSIAAVSIVFTAALFGIGKLILLIKGR